MNVLLTGASGLVGRAAARALKEAGHRTRLLHHRTEVPAGFEVCHGSLAGAGIAAALQGVDAVVHAAASLGGERATLQTVNVTASRQLFLKARECGVERVVFLSTSGVYSRDGGRLGITEDHPVGTDDPYCDSKLTGEQIGREILGERLTILRPVSVYRTGPCPLVAAIAQLLSTGAPMPHNGREDTLVDLLHADDLAHGIALAVGRGQGEVFNLAGPETIGFRAVVESLATRLGIAPKWSPIDSDASFEPGVLIAATAPQTLSIERARDRLGYRPTHRWPEEVVRLDPATALRHR